MTEARDVPARLRFGVFELDLRTGELRKRGAKVRLQDQPFQVLAILLEKRGQLVTREDLRQRLWTADTFVDFDHGLNKAINKLRDALGDSAASPRFIETVARRGYRFIGDVSAQETVGPPGAPTQADSDSLTSDDVELLQVPENAEIAAREFRPYGWMIAAAGFAALASGLLVLRLVQGTNSSATIRSLAVLPLVNLTGDASEEYFADGMTDQLIANLSQIAALRVISRTSVMLYKRAPKALPQIARELNVDAVVEGTVLRSGARVRITTQLIDAVADRHLWAQSYDGDLRDTLALQNTVARAIAEQIRINVSPREQAALKDVRAVDPEALEAYLKGRYFWNKRTADGLERARDYFDQAIAKDTSYAQAYSGLADTYALLGDWQYAVMSVQDALPKAKASAIKALELDDTLGEAHTSLAFCLDGYDWDLTAGDKEFRRALELNPGYATGHHWYAWHLGLLGRDGEAIVEMKKAQSLDPLSLIINTDLAELFVIAHRYDESIQQSRKTIEMDPGFGLAHYQLAQAYLSKRLFEQAIAELHKAIELSRGCPVCAATLARAYAESGRRSDAVQLLNELKRPSSPVYSNAPEIAAVYTALGDKDQAMEWLDKGYQERINPGVLLRPGFDPLRTDSRFLDLARRMGLRPNDHRDHDL